MPVVEGYKKRSYSFFLEKTGIWYNPGRNPIISFLQRSRAYYCTISTILQLYSIFGTGYNKKTLQETAFFGMVGILISTQLLHYQTIQRGLLRMFALVDSFQEEHTEEWQREIFQKEAKKAWKIVDHYWRTLMVYCFFYLYLPIIVDTLLGIVFPNFPDIRVPVPLQGFIDHLPKRSPENVFLSLAGATWAVFSIMGHIGIECTPYLAIIFTNIEMRILREKVARLNKSLLDRPNQQRPFSMTNILQHHQKILRTLDVMNELFGFPIAAQNVFFSVCFCVAMYSVAVVENKDDLMPALQNLYSMSCCLGIVCFLCIKGESLETQNSLNAFGMYDLPWYQEGTQFRRDLLTMLTQANRPYVINFHQGSHLNVNTFMQIMNTAYSYFMMLKSTT